MKKVFFAIAIILNISAYSQDYTWWNQIHQWDGHTSWLKYITVSPQYLGPNALPVPDAEKGLLNKNGYFQLAADAHFSKGDHTQNFYSKLFYPIVKNIVACEVYVVPFEHFKMDTITRDIRAARDKDGEGTAGGDIYFGTLIQLVKDKNFPDVLLRMSFRTASGTNVSSARYTDGSGYFFDLSFGKEYAKKESWFKSIRPFIDLGFYSWQTNSDGYRQNDAPYYAAGISLAKNDISLSSSLAGYHGYLKNDDTPMVFRTEINLLKTRFQYSIAYQYGIVDFPYQSIRLSVKYIFNDKWLLKSGRTIIQ